MPGNALVHHVLDRLSYGSDGASLDRIRSLGVDNWIREQLRPQLLTENPILTARLAALPPAYTPFNDPLWHPE